jgi:hypothetical protein
MLVNAGILEERRAERERTFVLSKPRLRTAICAAFREDPGRPKKSQSPVPKRLSPLPLVSRELISRYNREELYKEVWSQRFRGWLRRRALRRRAREGLQKTLDTAPWAGPLDQKKGWKTSGNMSAPAIHRG